MDKRKGRDAEPEPEQPTVDEGPMRDFLKGKGMDDASIEEAVKLMHPGGSEGEDEHEEEEADDEVDNTGTEGSADDDDPQESEESEETRGKKFAGKGGGSENKVGVIDKKGGKDKRRGKDEPPPFEGMPKTKAAMDAMKKEIREAAIKQMRAVRAAELKVEPFVGKLAIAHDSAPEVFKTALGMLGVKDEALKQVPASAYEAMFDIAPKPTRRGTETIAVDAAKVASFAERHPNAARIRHA